MGVMKLAAPAPRVSSSVRTASVYQRFTAVMGFGSVTMVQMKWPVVRFFITFYMKGNFCMFLCQARKRVNSLLIS